MNLFSQAFEAIASSSGAYKCKTKCVLFVVVYMVFIAFNVIMVLIPLILIECHSIPHQTPKNIARIANAVQCHN